MWPSVCKRVGGRDTVGTETVVGHVQAWMTTTMGRLDGSGRCLLLCCGDTYTRAARHLAHRGAHAHSHTTPLHDTLSRGCVVWAALGGAAPTWSQAAVSKRGGRGRHGCTYGKELSTGASTAICYTACRRARTANFTAYRTLHSLTRFKRPATPPPPPARHATASSARV